MYWSRRSKQERRRKKVTRGIFSEDEKIKAEDLFDPYDSDSEMKESIRMFKEELEEIVETYLNPWLKE